MRFLAPGLGLALVVASSCSLVYDTDKYTGNELPGAPALDAIPEQTNENPLTITGSGEAGAIVEVRGGESTVASAEVNADGSFAVDVPLRPNAANRLQISQARGPAEGPSVATELIHDDIAPGTPFLDPVVTPTRRTESLVRGSAEPGAEIFASSGGRNASGVTDADGRFSISVPLDADASTITEYEIQVTATDAAGNVSGPAGASVVHNPSLPIDAPLVDVLPPFTSDNPFLVTGLSEPNLSIEVVGGTSEAITTSDGNGVFSLPVDLVANSENQLSVFATIPASGVTSSPFPVTITHDAIAPGAPSADPVPSPTGATLVRITGTSEGRATISVAGGATVAGSSADESGAYSIDVMLMTDATNELEVTATDRAGNSSGPTLVTIEQDSDLEAPVLVDPVATPTRQSTITLTGSAAPSIDVEVSGGASLVATTTSSSGMFSVAVPLNQNTRNDLVVRRVGSSADTFVVVVHDNIAPTPPTINPVASPTNRVHIVVSGATEPHANLNITGGQSTASGAADGGGQFSIQVTIEADSMTTLVVTAQDRAGNVSNTSSVVVEHSSAEPDLPVVDDTSPPPTNQITHTVTGHVTEPGPDVTIDITNGAAPASGQADPDNGTFSIEVTLNSNQVNQLDVISTSGEIVSSATVVTITHDDVAPDAPDMSRISFGSRPSSCILGIRGSTTTTGGAGAVEAFAGVSLINSSATSHTAQTTADAEGIFSTTITACPGDQISYRATDAAGNVGPATSVEVD